MENFSRRECLRVANGLKERVDQGKVTKIKRGLYQIETYDADVLTHRRMKALGPDGGSNLEGPYAGKAQPRICLGVPAILIGCYFTRVLRLACLAPDRRLRPILSV